ncbi:hypothetical protein GCM10029976_081960 [Kribbella albertanoniae]
MAVVRSDAAGYVGPWVLAAGESYHPKKTGRTPQPAQYAASGRTRCTYWGTRIPDPMTEFPTR